VCEWSELAADVEEVEDADDKDGDNKAIEHAAVGDETRQQPDCEPSEEQRDDDRVDEVPHVRVEDAEFLTTAGRLQYYKLHTRTSVMSLGEPRVIT